MTQCAKIMIMGHYFLFTRQRLQTGWKKLVLNIFLKPENVYKFIMNNPGLNFKMCYLKIEVLESSVILLEMLNPSIVINV